jgi:mycofactocin precursor
MGQHAPGRVRPGPYLPLRTQEEPAMSDSAALNASAVESTEMIEDELLVEDVSIDGMCGVY